MNLGCDKLCGRNVTMLYLRADGPNDTLHYLWNFVGKPTVLLALTAPTAWLNVDWQNYLAGKKNSLNFTEEPIYSFGVIINKVNSEHSSTY